MTVRARKPHAWKKAAEAEPGRMRLFLDRMALTCGWLAVLLIWGAIALQHDWAWPHRLSSSGGAYFFHRVVIPVPPFSQGDTRWRAEHLGQTPDTIGGQGCALTCAAMILSAYGVKTDPQRLNQFLNTHEGYTPQGWLTWEKASDLAPQYVEKAYEDLPSYALIDGSLRLGNPVIIRLLLPNHHTHFVVIVGKQGWDYLIQDPANWERGVYPLKERTSHIEALRFYRVLGPVSLLLTFANSSVSS